MYQLPATISNLPDHERPRERLLQFGPQALADRELLAMVLRNGRQQCSAIELASSITNAVGSLDRLAGAHVDDLCAIPGVGAAKASAVISAFELGRRALRPASANPTLSASHHIATAARPLLAGLLYERLVLFVTDNALRLHRTLILQEGTKTAAQFSVRDVLQAVLRSDGCAFALAHNHPSGDPSPSDDDVRATRALGAAAQLVGLQLLDHVVIAGERWQSVC